MTGGIIFILCIIIIIINIIIIIFITAMFRVLDVNV